MVQTVEQQSLIKTAIYYFIETLLKLEMVTTNKYQTLIPQSRDKIQWDNHF